MDPEFKGRAQSTAVCPTHAARAGGVDQDGRQAGGRDLMIYQIKRDKFKRFNS